VRAVVVGAKGQLGRALVARLGASVVWSGGREELDVRDGSAVFRTIDAARPDVVFNATAYNAVDLAERDPADALAVNTLGPRHLAFAARRANALLVHVSTDYVFDGEKSEPYREDDYPRPLSVYGVSKLAGEAMVAAAGGAYLLVRTSAVIGTHGSRDKGGSFVERVIAQARADKPLKVVADQVFAPTCAPDLAGALVALVEKEARGVFHVTNGGSCSWHELAVAALAAAKIDRAVETIRAQDLGRPARRPAYSVLSNEKYRDLGLAPLRDWRDTLKELVP
jgi:dTDP-4-dehydrorhamnose reductase